MCIIHAIISLNIAGPACIMLSHAHFQGWPFGIGSSLDVPFPGKTISPTTSLSHPVDLHVGLRPYGLAPVYFRISIGVIFDHSCLNTPLCETTGVVSDRHTTPQQTPQFPGFLHCFPLILLCCSLSLGCVSYSKDGPIENGLHNSTCQLVVESSL